MEAKVNVINSVDTLLIGFKITSVDLEKGTCNLRVTCGIEGSLRSKLYKDIYISSLLKYNLVNDKPYIRVGEYYESSINSEDFHKNPLCLIRYTDKSDNGERYLLTMVKERPSLRREIKDPFGNVYYDYVYRYHTKSNYKRWRNYVRD